MLNTTCAPGAPTDPGNRTVVDACPPAAMVPNETGIEVVVGVPAKLTLVNCTTLAAGISWTDCETGVAAAQLALPPCVAWMVHVPPWTMVTVFPDTVQTGSVWLLKLTVSPEDAVALMVNGASPKVWFGIGGKLMVCEPCVTVTVSLHALLFLLLSAITFPGSTAHIPPVGFTKLPIAVGVAVKLTSNDPGPAIEAGPLAEHVRVLLIIAQLMLPVMPDAFDMLAAP